MDKLTKDIAAKQQAHDIVKGKWASTINHSIAEALCERIMARIEQSLDVMAVIALNR